MSKTNRNIHCSSDLRVELLRYHVLCLVLSLVCRCMPLTQDFSMSCQIIQQVHHSWFKNRREENSFHSIRFFMVWRWYVNIQISTGGSPVEHYTSLPSSCSVRKMRAGEVINAISCFTQSIRRAKKLTFKSFFSKGSGGEEPWDVISARLDLFLLSLLGCEAPAVGQVLETDSEECLIHGQPYWIRKCLNYILHRRHHRAIFFI